MAGFDDFLYALLNSGQSRHPGVGGGMPGALGGSPQASAGAVGMPVGPSPLQPVNGSPQAQSGPMAAAIGASAPPPSADAGGPNPFNALLDPSRGGLLGLFGRLAGNPTRAEAQQQKYAEAQRQGLIGLQRRITDGMPVQNAIVDFVNSKEGQGFFASSADPVGAIRSYVQTVQKAVPPVPEAVQTFNQMADEAGLTPEERKQAARVKILPDVSTDEQKNFEFYAKRAGWDDTKIAEVAGKILQKKGNRLVPTTVMGQFGPIPALMDPDTMQVTTIGADPNPAAAPAAKGEQPPVPVPGATPAPAPAPAGTLPPGPPLASTAGVSEVPGDIILGSGITSGVQDLGGGLLEQAAPGLFSTENASRRNQLAQVAAGFQNLQKSMAGKSLASDKAIGDAFARPASFMEGPQTAGQRLLDGHAYLDRLTASAQKILADPNKDYSTKKDTSDLLAQIEQTRALMPSPEAIQAAMEAYAQSRGQIVPGIEKAGKLPGQLGKAAGDIEKAATGENAPQVFATEAEAAAAAKAGTLKVGDKVVIGGKSGTMQP